MIKSQRDFYTGLLFTAIGLFFGLTCLNLEIGNPANMGPAFLPLTVSIILTCIGLLQIFRSVKVNGEKAEFKFRDPFAVVAMIVIFALTVEHVGVLLSLFLLMLASAYLHKNFNFKHFIISYTFIFLLMISLKYLLKSTIPLTWI